MCPYNKALNELAERRVIEEQELTSEQVEMIKIFEIQKDIELNKIKKEIKEQEEKHLKLNWRTILFGFD